MTGFALVLLFTVGGLVAAWLAVRVGGDEPVVRWLARAFCVAALGNLAFQFWPVIAADPHGSAVAGGVVLVLSVAVCGYARLLRRLRRMAEQARDGF